MTCEIKRGPSGGAIICRGRARRKRCWVSECGGWEERLCDFKLSNGSTCSRPLCRAHAVKVTCWELDLDLCKEHARTVGFSKLTGQATRR